MHHQTKHLAALIAAIGLSAATGAWAAPDLSACQTCHADLTKTHASAGHKDVACTTCHGGVEDTSRT